MINNLYFGQGKPYTERAQLMAERTGDRLAVLKAKEGLDEWHFHVNTTAANADRKERSTHKKNRLLSNTTLYGKISRLISSPRFFQLNPLLQRTLRVLQDEFATRQPSASTVDSNPDNTLTLSRDIQKRQNDLIAFASNSDNPYLIADKIPSGYNKPFSELLRDLVKKRNELARRQGFDNFFSMCMAEFGIDAASLDHTISQLKPTLDRLSESINAIRPDIPATTDPSSVTDNPIALLTKTAHRMGIPATLIHDLISKSDLHPHPHKSPMNMAILVNPPEDVRISVNIPDNPNEISRDQLRMELMHEFLGHGLDFKMLDPKLPKPLQRHDNLTAEAFADLFEMLFHEEDFQQAVLLASPDTALQNRYDYLDSTVLLTRNLIALIEFEKGMYENPDRNLDQLYLDTQGWAQQTDEDGLSNIPGYWSVLAPHFISNPAYMPNYLFGSLWSAQVMNTLKKRFGSMLTPQAGQFLMQHRSQGLRYTPQEEIIRMTGKPLAADAFNEHLNTLAKTIKANIQEQAH